MKKRRKAYSVDAMIRFFLQYYNIPTKKDFEKLLTKMDRLEAALNAAEVTGGRVRKGDKRKNAGEKEQIAKARARVTATSKVLGILKTSPQGIDVAGIKAKCGFEDKKIRNIIFRLLKAGAIKRIGRGTYAIK